MLSGGGIVVHQYLVMAKRTVFAMGTWDLPKRFDVFNLLQRSHDLWGVLHHAGVHGRGTHAARVHRGP